MACIIGQRRIWFNIGEQGVNSLKFPDKSTEQVDRAAGCCIVCVIQSALRYGSGIGLLLLLVACRGQVLGATVPVSAVVVATIPPDNSTTFPLGGSPTPDCTDTIQVTLAVHTFLNNYNTGDLTALLHQFSPSFSAYEDGSELFTGTTLTDAQQHLMIMFAKHDQLTAPDDGISIQIESGQMSSGYYVTLNNVTRHNDKSTKVLTGSIVIGMDCITRQVNAIAMKMR